MNPVELVLHHIAATTGILPRELARRITWRDLQNWLLYFEHINRPAAERDTRPNLLDDPDALVRSFTSHGG